MSLFVRPSFPSRPTKRRYRAQRGFTLAELMAVISLSAFSLGFIFYLLIQSSRIYSSQDSYYAIHNATRYASLILEAEFRRAGLMTPLGPNDTRFCHRTSTFWGNNNPSRTAPRGPYPIYFENGSTIPTPTFEGDTQNQNIRADALEIMGNFATNQDYRAELRGNEIELIDMPEGGFDGFRRAFFNRGQLLSVRSSTGRFQLVQVNNDSTFSDNTAASNVFISRRLPIKPTNDPSDLFLRYDEDQVNPNAIKCGIARGTLVRIAPIMRKRYEICAHPVSLAPTCIRLGNNAPAPSNQVDIGRWYLRRTPLFANCSGAGSCQWSPAAPPDLTSANTAYTRVFPPIDLIENIVDLQFGFAVQNNNQLNQWLPVSVLPTGPSNFSGTNFVPLYDGTTTGSQSALVTDPLVTGWPTQNPQTQSIRMLFYRLSVRGDVEERGLTHRVRNNAYAPLLTFNLRPFTGGAGSAESAARVRTITGGIMLYSFMQTR